MSEEPADDEHVVLIVPMINMAGREVFTIECSCNFTVRGYTSSEAAKAGGKKHIRTRSIIPRK